MNSAQITVTACPIDEALRGYRDADPAIIRAAIRVRMLP